MGVPEALEFIEQKVEEEILPREVADKLRDLVSPRHIEEEPFIVTVGRGSTITIKLPLATEEQLLASVMSTKSYDEVFEGVTLTGVPFTVPRASSVILTGFPLSK